MTGLVVYWLAFRLDTERRVTLALVVFAVSAAVVNLWVVAIGNSAPPDAVTVSPDGKVAPESEEKKP